MLNKQRLILTFSFLGIAAAGHSNNPLFVNVRVDKKTFILSQHTTTLYYCILFTYSTIWKCFLILAKVFFWFLFFSLYLVTLFSPIKDIQYVYPRCCARCILENDLHHFPGSHFFVVNGRNIFNIQKFCVRCTKYKTFIYLQSSS